MGNPFVSVVLRHFKEVKTKNLTKIEKKLKVGRNIFIEPLMQLSVTLRSPLDQYVDDYFGSKVKDLATAFNLPETDIVYV